MDNFKIEQKRELAEVKILLNMMKKKTTSKQQFTFVALKPDSVNLTAINVVMKILNDNGYKVVFHAPAVYDEDNVRAHYQEIYTKYRYEGKCKFYPELEEYLTRGPIYGLVIQGENAVKGVKKLCGDTSNPASGTMRNMLFKAYNLEYDKNENGIHASGEVDEAKREIVNFISAVLQNNKRLGESQKYTSSMQAIVDCVNEYDVNNVNVKEC